MKTYIKNPSNLSSEHSQLPIGNVLLCDVYPNWLYIEPIANKLLMHILKEYGRLNKENYERVYNLYVLPYFRTWDNFSCCTNGDVQYSPVVLSWYAEKIGVKPTYPLRVMRQVAWSLQNII
jgi:hypothetical protein